MKINRPTWEAHGPTGSLQGQDTFASLLLPHRTFVDVGAGHGIFKSNTWNLERMGWRGLLFDRNPEAVENCRSNRVSPSYCIDVTTFDFTECFRNHKLPKVIDYISFDVDRATAMAVMNFPFEEYQCQVFSAQRSGQAAALH